MAGRPGMPDSGHARTSPLRTMTRLSIVRIDAGEWAHYAPLVQSVNPRISLDRWRNLFDWGWQNPRDHIGYGLVWPDGNPVGFVSTLYSRTEGHAEGRTLCNLGTWYVKPEFRSYALPLIGAPLSDPELSITNLTPTVAVNQMFTALGFKVLESHIRVFHPWPRPRPYVEVLRSPEAWPVSIARIAEDHDPVAHVWAVKSAEGSTEVVFTLGRRRRLRTARIHFISDVEVFRRVLGSLVSELRREFGCALAECDERLLCGAEIAGSRKLRLPVKRLFRSPDGGSTGLSNLYSELVLLQL